MKRVFSFSGGRTSAYGCGKLIKWFGRENCEFVYMDTGQEHPLTYKFIKQVNEHFNLNLKCIQADFSGPLNSRTRYKVIDVDDLKTDFSVFKAMLKKYGVPYVGGMFCTSRLKTRPFKAYCDKTYGKDNYNTFIGIRADEPARLIGDSNYKVAKKLIGCDESTALDMFKDYVLSGVFELRDHFSMDYDNELNLFKSVHEKLSRDRMEGKRYLAEISDFDKQDINEYWAGMPFDLEIPEWLGNCMFCPKKSNLKLAAAAHDEKAYYEAYVQMVKDEHVRIDKNTGHWSKMYRGKQSLESLIGTFDGATGKEIKGRIRGERREASGSCSESCEML